MMNLKRFLSGSSIASALLIPEPASSETNRYDAARKPVTQFNLSGESRWRYETLDGQFRRNGTGSDQLLAIRSLLHANWDTGPVSFGVELQDSRTYLGDEGTPISTSAADPLDILQLYITLDDVSLESAPGWTTQFKLGRQTLSVGSDRFIERTGFSNAIDSYSGLFVQSEHTDGSQLQAFLVVPVASRPTSKADLLDNRMVSDTEQWGRRIWGLNYRKSDVLPQLISDLWLETFVYGLEENDTRRFQTPDRSFVEPGFRLLREPKTGQWDLDLEVSFRTGTRYASSEPSDTQSLNVQAEKLFLAAGYTFKHDWQPRFALEYYYASGDENPTDLNFDQYERLFGSRRSDLNNTSIYGPLAPANLSAPGFRLEIKPSDRFDARLYYHSAFLASETDKWVVADLHDPTGQSGRFIGHTLDSRARYWLVPDSVRAEIGASLFLHGDFARNAPDAPEANTSFYSYFQLTFSF